MTTPTPAAPTRYFVRPAGRGWEVCCRAPNGVVVMRRARKLPDAHSFLDMFRDHAGVR